MSCPEHEFDGSASVGVPENVPYTVKMMTRFCFPLKESVGHQYQYVLMTLPPRPTAGTPAACVIASNPISGITHGR